MGRGPRGRTGKLSLLAAAILPGHLSLHNLLSSSDRSIERAAVRAGDPVRSNWLEKGKRWLAECRFGRTGDLHRPNTSETGMKGEMAAYAYLKRQGYRIVAHRYRSRSGEIDLIGWDGDILAFIEVKYRRNRLYGGPEDAVGPAKQRLICRAAADYRRGLRRRAAAWRFDIVGIQGSWEDPEVFLIKDAFREPGRTGW